MRALMILMVVCGIAAHGNPIFEEADKHTQEYTRCLEQKGITGDCYKMVDTRILNRAISEMVRLDMPEDVIEKARAVRDFVSARKSGKSIDEALEHYANGPPGSIRSIRNANRRNHGSAD